jgi:methionyl aminopeptidase
VYHNGYHSDRNETFFVGKVDKVRYHLVKSTHECLFKAIAACKPGVRYRDMGNIISKHAHSQGLSVGKSYCGHGINTLFHTAPNVPHYEKNKAAGVMKPGHVFTIEPMINAGDLHVLAASTTLSLIPLPLPRQTASVRCFPRSTTAVT